jgi:excisionase family DNA binding protein
MLESPERSSEKWLTPSEVVGLFEAAGLFRVPLTTLRDWAEAGKINASRTLGGHRRYRESDIRALIEEVAA